MKSPITYFGGKGNFYKEILAEFPSQYGVYIEPFCGGATVFFQKPPTPVEIINDINEDVYALFLTLSVPELKRIFKERCDVSFYSERLRAEAKEMLKSPFCSVADRAYYFFVSNRLSRNGVGGFKTALNCVRRNMSKNVSDFLAAIDGLEEIHLRLSKTTVMNRDALEVIAEFKERPDVFMYLDPPYHWDTRTATRYKNDFTPEQQTKLIDLLLSSKAMILLSGYDNNEYSRLEEQGWGKKCFPVKTKDGNNNPKTKTECLWMNYQKRVSSETTDTATKIYCQSCKE